MICDFAKLFPGRLWSAWSWWRCCMAGYAVLMVEEDKNHRNMIVEQSRCQLIAVLKHASMFL